MNPLNPPEYLLSVFFIVFVTFLWRFMHNPGPPYPPGPPGLPILGNIFDLPTSSPWIEFAKWGKKYGPVVYLNLLGRPLVVLNTAKAAVDLLERRGAKYADRPDLFMAGELIGYKHSMVMSPYDHVFRERRKIISGSFGEKEVSCFHEYLEIKTVELACSLLNNMDGLSEILKWHTASVIFRAVYGLDIGEQHSHHVSAAYQCGVDFLNVVTPGRFLVDSLPFLGRIPSWVPWSPQWQARKWRKNADKMWVMPYDEAKRHIIRGTSNESLLSRIFSRQGDSEVEKKLDPPIMTASLLIAGFDTIGNALHAIIIALMNHPGDQRKGQAEVDKIVGSRRLPSFKDRDDLPYVVAFCNEVLRLHISAPLGFIHVASSDDFYEGYHIPAGTMVLSNIWGILNDPQNFQDPWKFNPERFLDKSDPGIDFVEFGFGHGRRKCPGKYLALDQLFITVATLLAVFDIRPAQAHEPSNFPSGIANRSETPNCVLTPRNPEVTTLLESLQSLDIYTRVTSPSVFHLE